jgi:ribosomal protein L37AE/L43A
MTASATESCCPGCDKTGGVEQTTSAPRGGDAWTCTRCGMAWAISLVNPHLLPAYLAIGAAAEEIGRLRWKLAQVVAWPTMRPGSPIGSRIPAGHRLSLPRRFDSRSPAGPQFCADIEQKGATDGLRQVYRSRPQR